jgi:Big-like domain-containing protein
MDKRILGVAVILTIASCTDNVSRSDLTGLTDVRAARDTSGGGGGGGGPDSSRARPGGPVATVTVTPDSQVITAGDSAGVFANLLNRAGRSLSGRTVTFASSDSGVVSVTAVFGQSALLQGNAPGFAIITATSEGVSGSAFVFVRPDSLPPPPDTIPPPPDTLPPPDSLLRR